MVSLCCDEGRRSHNQDSVLPMAGCTQSAPAAPAKLGIGDVQKDIHRMYVGPCFPALRDNS